MDASKGVVSYVFSNAVANPSGGDLIFKITLEAFRFSPCILSNATVDDVNIRTAPVIKVSSCDAPKPQTCNGAGVCGVNDLCCQDYKTGRRCYNPNLASCVLDEDLRTVLCGFYDGACNGVCYDKRHYTCDNGTLKFTGKRAQ
jgi:hypothetical protein